LLSFETFKNNITFSVDDSFFHRALFSFKGDNKAIKIIISEGNFE